MVDERWYEKLESAIFTTVSTRMRKELVDKVEKTIKFTSIGSSTDEPYFPTCYIHELQPAETGQDLEGDTINAVIETIEIIVYSRSRTECKLIIYEAAHQMKRLRFSVTAMPITTIQDNVSTGVARFRRIVGSGDSDLVK